MSRSWRALVLAPFLWAWLIPGLAVICVTDGAGQHVKLMHPAKNIVSLAPNLTEILFAMGAGRRIVGTSSNSDYPVEARKIPVIGHPDQINLEAIVAKQPQLVVAWQGGNPLNQVQKLRKLGIVVYIASFKKLSDIALTLKNLGKLTGNQQQADAVAVQVQQQLQQLRARYRGQQPIRVFYQVWHQPIFTISRHSIINQVIDLCGGENVFADTVGLAPRISQEAVLAANPQVIIAGEKSKQWQQRWRKWPEMTAVKAGNLFTINPDLLERFGPRLVAGAQQICHDLAIARKRLAIDREGKDIA